MNKISIRKHVEQLPADKLQHIQAVLTSEAAKGVATNVLIIAGVLGAVGLLFTAPNALKLFAPLLRRKYKRPLTAKEQRQKMLKTFYYLKQTGQIRIEEGGTGLVARLTQKGRRRFKQLQAEVHSIAKPLMWDGMWWLVAADIPTKEYRIAADMFRIKLKELQFYSLQRTFWMHPFDPRKELEYIANKYSIGRFITVMQVNKVDTQDKKKLLTYFKSKRLL